ncbi:hypothetical protein ACFVHW_07925 [Streptomyces sp. NPDC127110]|uniref:hypothetical protein n=1 Tax=Streptomyces sp. NPDC127110 TaxID=3345362 RepID=UPI0036314F9D
MTDEFRGWRWDREDAAAGRQALVLHRWGHVIRCDHQGLLIDGDRVDTVPLYQPVPVAKGEAEPAPIELGDDGRLLYRGRHVATFSPPLPGTFGPGPYDLYAAQTPYPRRTALGRSTAA